MRILAYAVALYLAAPGGAKAVDRAAAAAPNPTGEAMAEMKASITPATGGSDDAAARSAKSIECSQKAEAQNLHGKPRKHFMRECKRGA